MINLNLLPWRENLKFKYQVNFYITLAGVVFLAILLLLVEYLVVSKSLSYQSERTNFLQTQADNLQKEIDVLKKAQEIQDPVMEQISFFAALNNQRFQVVRFFNELPSLIPEGVYLTKIEYDGKRIDLDGEAQNNGEILLFVKKIAQSTSMSEPILENIMSASEEEQFRKRFEIAFQFK